MRPTAARSNRSSVHHLKSSSIPNPSTTSSIYHHQQQQQQQILYAPVSSPMVTLQSCGTALHPSCVYPSVQSHVISPNSAHLQLQGLKDRLQFIYCSSNLVYKSVPSFFLHSSRLYFIKQSFSKIKH